MKRVSSSFRFFARRCFCSNHMPIAVTGLSSANSAKRASPSRSTIAPASTSGAATVIQLNFDAGATSLRVGGDTGSVSVSRPGRGGRLNGAVAAGVRLGNVPAAGTVVSGSSGRSSRTAPPTMTLVVPVSRTPSSSMRSPAMTVPFVDPESRTRTPSSSRSTVQCSQDALSVGSTTSACGARPTTSRRLRGTGTTTPAPRPPARVTLHPSTARGGSSVVRATRDPSRSTRSRNGVSELVR